jgi:hypothetical protein
MASIELTKDVEDAIGNAGHKLCVLIGLLKGPKKNKLKTAIIEGLIRSLDDDIGTIVCEVHEAHYRERKAS